jgi:hypothetical protein
MAKSSNRDECRGQRKSMGYRLVPHQTCRFAFVMAHSRRRCLSHSILASLTLVRAAPQVLRDQNNGFHFFDPNIGEYRIHDGKFVEFFKNYLALVKTHFQFEYEQAWGYPVSVTEHDLVNAS